MLNEFLEQLKAAHEATENAYSNYAHQSTAHKAALEIMQFEKEIFYGDKSSGRHLQKIREIIESNTEGIINEID